MPEYLTPGVYYERVDASPPTISVLRTDVTGFVGISERRRPDASAIGAAPPQTPPKWQALPILG